MSPRPDHEELDAEIRAHMAIAIRERIEQGDDPETARLAALREFGYVPAVRESMRRVWYGRWFDAAEALWHDIGLALRTLRRAKGLALTVVATLALGIGANAAIFSVVRGVLLRPLVNRDENRLVYLRQSAPGIGVDNLAFSVPEIRDFQARASTIAAFGDFSTIDFNLVGVSPEPRSVRAGVVGGSFFDVMGLRPVLGRLLNASDDRPDAPGVVVLTYRFWTTALHGDRGVVGRGIRLGESRATIVGVLEPSVPYPAATEIIANIPASPHHLGATMVTSRTHRMTELFGRLAPDATLESARAELATAYAAMMRAHPEAYSTKADMRLSVSLLRDQISAPARPILLVLLAAAAVVFAIACSNVANLILARSVRRESELAIRVALGAGPAALRRTLLAESLVLCGAGAVVGVAVAKPLVDVVSRFAARFSVRALDVSLDPGVAWVGAALALGAAILLAYVPTLPSSTAPAGLGLTSGSSRLTPATNRRLRAFATAQIAFSFVLLAGAGMLLATLFALQRASTGFDMRQVLAVDVPPPVLGSTEDAQKALDFYAEATRRVRQLPGVEAVAAGSFVPWRDAGNLAPGWQFTGEGYTPAAGEENPHARMRIVAPHFFATVGVPLRAGRDFSDADRAGATRVAIVSESVARRLFPDGDALNRTVWWTDPTAALYGLQRPRRIVGIVADVDDETVAGAPFMTIYHPLGQMGVAGRLFVRAAGDPYSLVPAVTRIIRGIAPEQVVERPATLEDVRAEVLASRRLNAFVISGFAAVAVLIAVVGVAGVLAFSVSARTREFGVRLAAGCTPRHLLGRVLAEGARIAARGIVTGAAGGLLLSRVAARVFDQVQFPGVLPLVAAAVLLVAAAIAASLIPASRASRVDVVQALRSE